MKALFHIDKACANKNKTKVMMEGTIREGAIAPRMVMLIPFNREMKMGIQIDTVQSLDAKQRRIIATHICTEACEAETIIGWNLADEEFIIQDDPALHFEKKLQAFK